MASEAESTEPEDSEVGGRSEVSVPEMSMATWFTERAREYEHVPAVHYRRDGAFVQETFSEFLSRARSVAGGFQDLGVEPGDRVALHSATRYEWSLMDAAMLLAGAILVPVYTTFSPSDAAYVVEDAGADYLVTDESTVPSAMEDVVEDTFVITDLPEGDLEGTPGTDRDPGSVAALIYTSGTTGDPKGVKLTHRNFLTELTILREFLPSLEPGQRGACYLPLAALAQRIAVYMYWDQGHAPAFMSPDSLVEDLTEIQPEIMVGVPRVWRRMHSGIQDEAADADGIKQSLLETGIDVAKAYGATRGQGSAGSKLRLKHQVMDYLVYSTLREKLGLSNVEYALTGAASIDAEVLHFFWGIDVTLIEIYGATETTAVCVANRIDDLRAGTVGKPVPGTDVKLAEDGEVMVRGPLVMDGYWNLPERTAATFEDGWYLTGDIGEWRGEYLSIVDRKKFFAVLDTGRNLYPDPIEQPLRRSGMIEEAMIVADGRKFVTALVQPNFEQLLAFTDEQGIDYEEAQIRRDGDEVVAVPRALVEHPEVRARIERDIDAVNEDLADFETIEKFTVIERALSVDEGELTPTLKKRRSGIAENFSDRIEAMYAESQ